MGIVRQKNNGGKGDNYTDQFDGKGENSYYYSHNPLPLPQAPKREGKEKGERKGGKKR